jgi:lipid-A-disaccharide synthase
MTAAALAQAMRLQRDDLVFTGIGNERMREAGFTLTASTNGWAGMGPLDAVGKIPALGAVMLRHAFALRNDPVDLLVLIDFGAFNLRFARTLRAWGYTAPILFFLPPGAWLDNAAVARTVARVSRPLTAFAHQRDFYRSLHLEIGYVGHPLPSLISPRALRSPAPERGGIVALLPGSRRGEVRLHLPRLLRACAVLHEKRPALEVLVSVAGEAVVDLVRDIVAREKPENARIVAGAREALRDADAAFTASGTAVLEAALYEVPTVAFYVVSKAQAWIARRMYSGRFITLPNILLDRPLIPELLQDDATPQRLAQACEEILRYPGAQLTGMRELRAGLGPPDALTRCADFALRFAVGR